MNPFQALRVAIRSLLRNKTRSVLTALGVIIGVAAFIAMVAIGEGARSAVQASYATMGSNLLIVSSGSSSSGGFRGGSGSQVSLTWDDLAAIQTEVPSVRVAAAGLRSNSSIVGDGSNWTTTITGTSPEYFDARSWKLASGVGLDPQDVVAAAKVAVLGQTVVDQLYGADVDPVGKSVRIKGVPFVVIGVLAKKGQSPMGSDYDDVVFIPQTTFQAKIQGGLDRYLSGNVYVSARTSDTSRTESEITALLRDRHRIQPGGQDDFSIRNLAEMASAEQEGTETLTTLLAAIAAVSLVVGGIGIMNIMLVSVTERTREIGLRMAVGARPRAILMQFLAEALVLSVAGGVLGVGLGLYVAQKLSASFGWPLLVQPDMVVLVLVFSAVVGVVFGLYPALRASRLDPIEALRFE